MRDSIRARLREAVEQFWKTRDQQAQKQGKSKGTKDIGSRAAVTGGAQMKGFVHLLRTLLCEAGLPEAIVFTEKKIELPGWYRPEKQWDLIVVTGNHLIAGIEFKSQIGSFGNNFNNRSEEAIGSATDLWAAYREGAFQRSARPWLGYLMLLEEAPGSMSSVQTKEPHFEVFPEFKDASYAKRYEILLRKLVRERLYDAACLLLSEQNRGIQGYYREPVPDLTFMNFCASLLGHVSAIARLCR
jgi:hypothetical protein